MATAAPPRLLVTRKLPQEVEKRLAQTYRTWLNEDDHAMTEAEIAERSAGYDGLVVTSADNFRNSQIERLPSSIGIMATYSVGSEHINLDAAKARGLAVTNTPDVLTDATADIVMLLMLGAARGAYWGERMMREDRWTTWTPTEPLGYDVSGRRLGILGLGRIGQAVARRAAAFGMELHYHNRSPIDPALAYGARYHETLAAMLPFCDFLSINCISTPETRNLIDAQAIALLPDKAILVNAARGDIVNDGDLIAALKSGKLAAAGLDVFKGEPNFDRRYIALDNVFLLPHLGSATHNTRIAMGMRAADNLDAFFAGKRPADLLT